MWLHVSFVLFCYFLPLIPFPSCWFFSVCLSRFILCSLSALFCGLKGTRRKLGGEERGQGERSSPYEAALFLYLRLTLHLAGWPSLVWTAPSWKHFSLSSLDVVMVSHFSPVLFGSLNSPHSSVNSFRETLWKCH